MFYFYPLKNNKINNSIKLFDNFLKFTIKKLWLCQGMCNRTGIPSDFDSRGSNLEVLGSYETQIPGTLETGTNLGLSRDKDLLDCQISSFGTTWDSSLVPCQFLAVSQEYTLIRVLTLKKAEGC